MIKHNLKIKDDGVYIDDTLINKEIFNQEMSEYEPRDKETEIDNLCMWISESNKPSDKTLMLEDLKSLMNFQGDTFLSSISTNDFIFPDDDGFNEECENILLLNSELEDRKK